MPRDAASNLLNEVWGDRGLPVDPVWIARQLGLDVIESDLDQDISGALFKEAGEDPVIVLNARDSKVRKRFTCAHEIGHYVKRLEANQANYEFVDLRGPTAANGCDPEEIFANQFAANLLMPEDQVRIMRRDGFHPSVIAARLGVSDDAIMYRLKNLRLA